MKKALSCVTKSPYQPSSFHILKNIALILASIGHGLRWSGSRHTQALGYFDRSVECILHSDLNLHPYKLQIVHSLSNQGKEVHLLIFFGQFQGILAENPELPNDRLMNDEAHFHLCGTVMSRTFDNGQLQILINFTIVPFMTQKLHFGVLFGPEESLDPTSLRMKMDKPSQSHYNITQRWLINF